MPPVTVLLKRGIWGLCETSDDGGTQRRRFAGGASRRAFWRKITVVAALFEIAFEGGERNLEGVNNVRTRHAAVESGEYTMAEISGVCWHSCSILQAHLLSKPL
jgi:hypothetical protein